ncbi:heat shock protein GrpE [Rosistilla carotiformis]|uniref:Protein GrpE n=1 Tax=Rosistilla carotiformis TaxID=2528017 RepID=A0A518JV95_9BACT|nr:nucleotide exchange factor GrpE [Rosistilla carotiformis]QDV69448.1 heat shock protein GrpE [Rosistilla carotiformis]
MNNQESNNPEDTSADEAGFDATSEANLNDEAFDAVAGEIGGSSEGPSLEMQLAEANGQILKLHAELENVRKRIRREADEQIRYASLPLIHGLLEVFDNLRRALEAAETSQSTSGLVEGVQMVAKQFEDTLGKFHCKPIPAKGETFDPHVHEAISQMPSDEFAAGTVMIEATQGFQLHDRVVRPSQVVVSTGN